MNCLGLFLPLSAGRSSHSPPTVTSDEERSCEVASVSAKMIRYCFQIKKVFYVKMKFLAICNSEKNRCLFIAMNIYGPFG